MPLPKPVNPFYLALVPAGIVFAVTACAYGVTTVRALNPHQSAEEGLSQVLDQHGMVILAVELAVLAILTVAAISTDDYWTRRFEAAHSGRQKESDQV